MWLPTEMGSVVSAKPEAPWRQGKAYGGPSPDLSILLTVDRAGNTFPIEVNVDNLDTTHTEKAPGNGMAFRRLRRLLLGIIALAAIGPYLHTLGNAFVFDDRIIIQRRAKAWADDPLWDVVRRDYWGDQRMDSLYRPVTTVSYVLNYRLAGDNPWAYRGINLILHAACCCCFFALTFRLFADWRMAFVASLVFAWHTLHVEPVAQVVGRAELLAAFGVFAALWLYVRDRQEGSLRPGARYLWVIAASALAMLSKESGMAVVPLVVFYDLWAMRFGRGDEGDRQATNAHRATSLGKRLWRLLQRRWSGLIIVSLLVLMLRAQVLGGFVQDRSALSGLDNPLVGASTGGRVLTPVVLLGRYVRLMLWPEPLSHDYSYDALPICTSAADPRFLWGLLCLLTMVAACVVSFRRRGRVLCCVGFFVLTYALVSNTVVLTGTIFAERLMYIPLAGFCWLVAMGCTAVADRLTASGLGARTAWMACVVPLAVYLTALGVLTVQRGAKWRDEPTLIADALRHCQDSVRLHKQASYHARLSGELEGAIAHLRRAIEIKPDDFSAHYMLGKILNEQRRWEEAIPPLLESFGHLPDEAQHLPAAELAKAYRALGKRQEAAAWTEKAQQIRARTLPR